MQKPEAANFKVVLREVVDPNQLLQLRDLKQTLDGRFAEKTRDDCPGRVQKACSWDMHTRNPRICTVIGDLVWLQNVADLQCAHLICDKNQNLYQQATMCRPHPRAMLVWSRRPRPPWNLRGGTLVPFEESA